MIVVVGELDGLFLLNEPTPEREQIVLDDDSSQDDDEIQACSDKDLGRSVDEYVSTFDTTAAQAREDILARQTDRLEQVLIKQAQSKCKIETSLATLRAHCRFDMSVAKLHLETLEMKWKSVKATQATSGHRDMVLAHLAEVKEQLCLRPDLSFTDCGKPSKSFEKSFVPAYEANIAAGMTETQAKVAGPPRVYLAQMLADTAIINSKVAHQFNRASNSAAAWAEKSEAGKHKIVAIVAAMVDPGSKQADLGGGILVSKMRVLCRWEGFKPNIINFEDGMTWQLVSQITDGNGCYRQYRSVLDDFIAWHLSTVDGQRKGWPFPKQAKGNDKEVIIHSSVPMEMAGMIRKHPTTLARTSFGKLVRVV
jgi:hypothetical protein